MCRARRAVVLIFQGKAEMVENGVGFIHSISETVPLPSVIRLARLIRRPRRQRKLTRFEIFNRDRYTCQYCGQQTRQLTLDHVIPRYRGGQHYLGECRQRLRGLQPPQGRQNPSGSQHEAHSPALAPERQFLLRYPLPLPEKHDEWQKYLPQ